MPGIIMDTFNRNGAHTNHDRNTMPNGVNGDAILIERTNDNDKALVEQLPNSKLLGAANGLNGTPYDASTRVQETAIDIDSTDIAERMQQAPPEITHITEGFEPLSRLLARLAQVTHNRLSAKVLELASMPAPSSVVNGNGTHFSNGADDNSGDNLKKKISLLNFAEDTHANWTKALVITQWSRVHKEVSKLIDLKVHLDSQRTFYDAAVYELSEIRRSLIHARVPNPDLRTAVEVLSTGRASWMPDLGYIDPQPLTAKDLLKSLRDLNTLLSIRLNLHEYDKLPQHFKEYTIKSGRVIFRVPGEFEVDLTIADEDHDKQFWFIDFRFLFTPAVSQIPENLRDVIEHRVNGVLAKDGLAGCYRYLHELVLTHKLSEIRKQAIELSRGRWIETLQIEPLHRALSIQYWVDRYGRDGPRSWIILGIDSGKRNDGLSRQNATSRVSIRWFRDSKEVKNHKIILGLDSISAEALLRNVISEHIFHILGSTHNNLRNKPLFKDRELSISMKLSKLEPKEPELRVQLTRNDSIRVTIEPVTGRFAISPVSRLTTQVEWKMNTQTRDPAANAHEFIENLRCVTVNEEIISRALSVGWIPIRNPGFRQEDLKLVVPRDTLQLSWFKRPGWSQEWVVALSASMSGERWWLIENISDPKRPEINSRFQIPLGTTSPNHTHAFLSALHLFAAAMVSNYTNLRALHSCKARYVLQHVTPKPTSSFMKVPNLLVKLSTILSQKRNEQRSKKNWAKDLVKISFHGVEKLQTPSEISPAPIMAQGELSLPSTVEPPPHNAYSDARKAEDRDEGAIIIAEACLSKPLPASLDIVKQPVDKDIAFHPGTGGFAFRLHTKVGHSAIDPLVERLHRVKQLVNFIDVIKAHEKTLRCDAVSLGQITFSYVTTSPDEANQSNAMAIGQYGKTYRATIDFNGANDPIVLALEKSNPHLRVLDYLTKVLNSPGLGLTSVATLLPLTLPLMNALNAIEEAWAPIDDSAVLILSRAIDWHIVRYNLPPTSSDQKARKIVLEIRLQSRKRQSWWHVRRENEPPRGERKNSGSGDEIDIILKPVWDEYPDGNGNGNPENITRRGMLTSGIATAKGIEDLVKRVDNVIRDLVTKGVAPDIAAELKEMQQHLLSPAHMRTGARQALRTAAQQQSGTKYDSIVID